MLRRVANLLPLWAWACGVVLALVATRYISAALTLPLPAGDIFGVADPDVWLRLTLVRDWLQTGAWFDHRYASNAPFTLPISPWTRPLDLAIAALVKLQSSTPLPLALMRASAILPLLWVVVLATGLVKSMRALVPHGSAPVLMLGTMMLTSPMMFNYFAISNADHHGLLAALWSWVIYHGITYREDRWRSPLSMGLLLALMLWISPEALALIAVIYGWFGLRWVSGYSPARPLARLATVIAIATVTALLIERAPSQLFTIQHDSLSIVHAVAMACIALSAWVLAACPARSVSRRLLWAVMAALACLGAIHAFDPRFIYGPMVDAVPFITETFLPHILEAQSLASQPLLFAVGTLIQPVVALLVCLRCARHSDGILRSPHAAWLAVLVAATTTLCLQQQRWLYYLYPCMLLPLAAWLGAWMNPEHPGIKTLWPARRLQFLRERSLIPRRMALLVAILALPLVLMVVGTHETAAPEKRARACLRESRRIIQSGELDRIAGGRALNLLAPTNLGGEILFFTRHQIVASNYHREGNAIKEVWDAYATTSEAALAKLFQRRRLQAMLVCPHLDTPENAVATRIFEGSYTPSGTTRVMLTTPKLSKKNRPVLLLVKEAL